MNTLVDFTTKVKGVEYIMAVTAIVSFILFWESLKGKPFKGLMEAGREDIKHIKENGLSLATLAAAVFTGIKYVISLPFAFVSALAAAVMKMAGGSATFTWRPTEAYLTGHGKTKKPGADRNKQSEKK